MQPKLIGLDLDDTFMWNVWHYNHPLWEAVRRIAEWMGAKAEYVVHIANALNDVDIRRIHEINPKTGREFKYGKDRFPGSLKVGYLEFCALEGIAPDQQLAEELEVLGREAFSKELFIRSIHADAKTVLPRLAEQGHELHLVTAGDEDVQQAKLAAVQEVGLLAHFTNVDIVEFDKTQTLTEIAEGFSGPKCFVGNSWDSDMVPALAAGYIGIFIPRFVWQDLARKDEILVEAEANPNIVLLESLADVSEAVTALT